MAKVTGLVGALPALIPALVLRQLDLPALVVVPGPAASEEMLDDLAVLVGADAVSFLPPRHLHPFETEPLASGPRNERAEALLRLASGSPAIYVTQPEALLEPSPDRDWVRRNTLRLKIGDDYPRSLLLANLAEAGYRRETVVDLQGQYAVRGGLLDIFPFGHEFPLRIEFDGDSISELRKFDPTTQRSVEKVEQFGLLIGGEVDSHSRSLLDLLPPGALIYWHDREAIETRIEQFLTRAESVGRRGAKDRGAFDSEATPQRLQFHPIKEIFRQAEGFRQVVYPGEIRRSGDILDFAARRPDPYVPAMGSLADYLQRYREAGLTIFGTADTAGECERFEELLTEGGLEGRTVTPALSGGFILKSAGLAVLTLHELWGRRRQRRSHARFRRRSAAFDLSSLNRGDLVVHTDYGIGRYEGLQTIKVRGEYQEVMRIRYQEDVLLYVRVEQFGLVEKFIGSEGAKPVLSRIGGTEWARTKKRTKRALEDMADELLSLYARRKAAVGHSYPSDTHWQSEMEASFEFDDTPDQSTATSEIKADLEAAHPMDRLLCGDVGFGKTEVAIRAAFKVVQESHQVAVLVPTTILAQQHYETFSERLAAYPVKIAALSRFQTSREQKATLSALREGECDIVIGTHRLLSKDVELKRLGLVIIDEEHRFGVRHKERLKQLKTSVDVLTMTATPIPRTLHLALMGARDTSQINTPPALRLPIQTEVHAFSEELIRDAILRETDRNGQVFFVHNRVESISAVKAMLERLVPGLRYAVAHGQMEEEDLERTMLDYMHQRNDVLICTTIIESGIDIPNANTLIVNRADKFGLAQLYQIRGRIGRSSRQAYAYLLTPPRLAMTTEARQRLATLAELTDLGSGMKVAMRDLEIRGAGNLLGSQQSGFINAVGFDLYTKLLEEAVRTVRGDEPDDTNADWETSVEFDGPALLPPDYIDDGDLRYDFYRRLARATDLPEIDRLERDLADRFGPPPLPAGNLLWIARLKLLSRRLRFLTLAINDGFLAAGLILPEAPEDARRKIHQLLTAAKPDEIEFKMTSPVQLIRRFRESDRLKTAVRFLQSLAESSILQG
ncbi:MAG: transcription-repair coupling factor [Calditrichaeota bacterium]|nr:transcription-repair coupling factor [Calditrichota bacterium]